jgi:tetratricopeptide (TPR) repeat protein
MTPMALDKSVAFFNQAIELQPTYAPAYADLSQVYVFLGIFGVHDSREMFLKARKAATKALELDETAAAAHNAMAMVHILHDWDWAAAETECRRAAELNPGSSLPHVHLADYLSIRGRHEEAIATYARVLELDPVSRVQMAFFGLILHRARRYDESIAYCTRALEIDPNYANALWFVALSLEQKGEPHRSVAALEKAASLSKGPHHRALLARAYALVRDVRKATLILDELKSLADKRYVSAFDLAVVYYGLNDLDSMFSHFEKAYQQRVFRIIELTFPMFDSLRTDARWQSLVRRIGLLQ